MEIDLEVEIKRSVEVTVHYEEIVERINQMETAPRWNFIAKLINEIDLDTDGLSEEHAILVGEWLEKKLTIFKEKI